MNLSRAHLPFLALAGAALLLAAPVALSACGGDDDDEPRTVDLTVTEEGRASVLTAPNDVEAGEVEINYTNNGRNGHDLQLIRVEDQRSTEAVIRTFARVLQGRPLPDWLLAAGGVGVTAPGETQTVTQVLEPGMYYAFDIEGSPGPPEPADVPIIEVTGDATEEELEADGGTVEAIDYGFESRNLEAGENEILFENTGAQPHHLLAAPIVGDATIAQVEQAFRGQGDESVVDERNALGTAVLEGGASQLVTLDLKPGRYVFYCFISDRQGGPPHVVKGMVDEVEVR
jgi:hypothetical protein